LWILVLTKTLESRIRLGSDSTQMSPASRRPCRGVEVDAGRCIARENIYGGTNRMYASIVIGGHGLCLWMNMEGKGRYFTGNTNVT